MTLKDKLEIGLKEDAPYRKDNLPEDQVRGPEIPAGPGRSPEVPLARGDKNVVPGTEDRPEDVAPPAQPQVPAQVPTAQRPSPQPPVEPRT
jgi:hypothetical protein